MRWPNKSGDAAAPPEIYYIYIIYYIYYIYILYIYVCIIKIVYSRKQRLSIFTLIKTVYVVGEEILCCLIAVRGIRLMTLRVLS